MTLESGVKWSGAIGPFGAPEADLGVSSTQLAGLPGLPFDAAHVAQDVFERVLNFA